MLSELPQPDPDALEHSARLIAHIKAQILAAGGWISFADYMDLALYAPGLGYYSAGALKLGTDGDFVTAPEISPLFSRCLASQCAEVLAGLEQGVVLELGAGSGVMAVDMLLELERLQSLPAEYLILEPSADGRARQVALLSERAAHLVSRVRWLEGMPEQPIQGVIVANEVVDALPVERFVIESGRVEELGVAIQADQLAVQMGPASAALVTALESLQSESDLLTHLPAHLPAQSGYTSELCLRLPAWVASLSDWLQEGVVVLFDYGFSQREYYLPERSSGTLRCYYRHRAHEDPFIWPGLQDITAWVDFSRLAAAAQTAGMEVAGYTTQAQFLLAAGLDEQVARETENTVQGDPQKQVELAHALRQLVLPGEMGESVKVMALRKGDVTVPTAMYGRDMRSSL
jgi:SAM-dependent MidA family methyltransferase